MNERFSVERILAATDFSTNADAAWSFARELATKTHGELLLLHVMISLPGTAPVDAGQDHERDAAAAWRPLQARAAQGDFGWVSGRRPRSASLASRILRPRAQRPSDTSFGLAGQFLACLPPREYATRVVKSAHLAPRQQQRSSERLEGG